MRPDSEARRKPTVRNSTLLSLDRPLSFVPFSSLIPTLHEHLSNYERGVATGVSDNYTLRQAPQLVLTMLHRPDETTRSAFQMLTSELTSFPDDLRHLSDEELRKYWTRLRLGFDFLPGIAADRFLGTHISKPVRAYEAAIRDEFGTLTRTLENMSPSDASFYLTVVDMAQDFFGAYLALSEGVDELADNMNLIDPQTKIMMDALSKTVKNGWDQCNKGWDWKQIIQIMDKAPHLITDRVGQCVYEALAYNILTQSTSPEGLIEELLVPERFVYSFAVGSNPDKDGPEIIQKSYPELWDAFKGDETLGDQSIPRSYLALPAIRLLQEARASLPAEQLQKALRDIVTYTDSFPSILSHIAATTFFYFSSNASDQEERELFEDLIQGFDSIKTPIKKALTDEATGIVWVGKDARLHVTDRTTNVQGPIIHISSGERNGLTHPDTQESEPRKLPVELNEIHLLPFVGETGSLPEAVVPKFLAEVLPEERLPSSTDLFDQITSLLDKKTSDAPYPPTRVFHKRLAGSLPRMKDAQAFGIEAVILQNGSVSYLFDREERAGTLEGRTLPLCLSGELTPGGELQIEGTDADFDLSPAHLYLTRLALELRGLGADPLSVQELNKEKDKSSQERNPAIVDLGRDANGLIKDWNGRLHGDLPEISLSTSSDSLGPVAIHLPEQRKVIFAKEMS